jgi:hypothetical protein
MDREIDGLIDDKQIYIQMDSWTVGKMDRWTDGQMDR